MCEGGREMMVRGEVREGATRTSDVSQVFDECPH